MSPHDLDRWHDDGGPVPDRSPETRAPTVADEISKANVIRLECHGPIWQALVGPDMHGGLCAIGDTAEGALYTLLGMCRDLGWVWDHTWRERRP